MKLILLKNNFEQALTLVEKIAGKNPTLPILETVLLETDKNILSCTCTDLEIAVQSFCPGKIEEQGKICVPVHLIAGLLHTIQEEKIQLELKENFLKVSTEVNNVLVKAFPATDFPIVPKIKKQTPVAIEEKILLAGLTQIFGASATSDLRPEISGIYCLFSKNQGLFVATDSFRLAEKKVPFQNPDSEKLAFILPAKTAQEMIFILNGRSGEVDIFAEPTQVFIQERGVSDKGAAFCVTSRLIEGEFPNYEQIIPKKCTTKFICAKDELEGAVKAAGLFTGKSNEVVFSFDSAKKEFKVHTKNPDSGEYKAVILGKGEGDGIEVAFNWKFILDGLQRMRSSEAIFELNGSSGPAMLHPVGDASYLYIVMPIKNT